MTKWFAACAPGDCLESEAPAASGGVVTVRSQQQQDGQLLFSIRDTGVGLPAGNVDQIFSALFTTKSEGSGMGLAMSRTIVESHGGRLWATANDGRGATFHFTLRPMRGVSIGDPKDGFSDLDHETRLVDLISNEVGEAF